MKMMDARTASRLPPPVLSLAVLPKLADFCGNVPISKIFKLQDENPDGNQRTRFNLFHEHFCKTNTSDEGSRRTQQL